MLTVTVWKRRLRRRIFGAPEAQPHVWSTTPTQTMLVEFMYAGAVPMLGALSLCLLAAAGRKVRVAHGVLAWTATWGLDIALAGGIGHTWGWQSVVQKTIAIGVAVGVPVGSAFLAARFFQARSWPNARVAGLAALAAFPGAIGQLLLVLTSICLISGDCL